MAEDETTNPLDGVLVSEEDYEAAAPDGADVEAVDADGADVEAVDADGLPDDLADQPGDDEPLDADTMHGTPYTTPMPLVAVGDADAVPDEPVPDDTDPAVLPSQVTAIIRTFVPYLVGWIIAGVAWATTPLGIQVPDEFRGWLNTALPVVLGTLYYMAAKWAEKRWPGIPWLGSTRMPLYTPPATGSVTFAVASLAQTGYVWWRGGRFTPAFRDSLAEADRLVPGFILTQGGFNGTNVAASAGTHAGDSADFSVRGKTKEQVAAFIEAQRRVGNAAWFRTTRWPKWGTRAHGFTSYHIHVVPNGYAAPSQAARAQVYSTRNGRPAGYQNGRDGLASNGVDAGPGHTSAYRRRTWWDFLALSKPKPGLPSTGVSGVNAIPRYYTAKPWRWIPEDGILGGVTLSRLQWQLNIRPTGKLDHYTVRALKVWLGNVDDGKGILAPLHVRQLQYRVGFRGAAQDGKWGPVTTRALQRYLNANR